MVAAPEMGDVQVLLPVILAALSWFVWHRLWPTSLYGLAAIELAWIGAQAMAYTYRTDGDAKPKQRMRVRLV